MATLTTKNRVYCFILVLFAVLSTHEANARDFSANVTYVAWKTLYLDVGRMHGMTENLNGRLYRDHELIGELSIAAVADSSSVATLSGDDVVAKVGDRVEFVLQDLRDELSSHAEVVAVVETQKPSSSKRSGQKSLSRVSGRVSLHTDIVNNRSEENVSYVERGISTKFTVTRVASDYSDMRFKYRGRKRAAADGGEWQHRLYEASINFEPSHANWRMNVGRIQAGSIAGIGYIDGGYGEMEAFAGLSFGAFAGAQAELDLSSSNLSANKAGVLAIYRDEHSSRARTQATLAVAGEYLKGNISREFIYQQFTHSVNSSFSLYESMDININRGWKHKAEGSTLSLANALVNARYSPARAISLNAGYDGRSRYYTWETHDTPDSLFDDALRHGFRAGADLTMLHRTRFSVQQSFRSEPHTSSLYPSATYSIASNALMNGRVGAMLRYRSFENRFTTGDQRSVSLGFNPFRGVDFRSEYGVTNYYFRGQDYTSASEWIRLTADVNARTGFFASINAEQSQSTYGESLRGFVDVGWRLR